MVPVCQEWLASTLNIRNILQYGASHYDEFLIVSIVYRAAPTAALWMSVRQYLMNWYSMSMWSPVGLCANIVAGITNYDEQTHRPDAQLKTTQYMKNKQAALQLLMIVCKSYCGSWICGHRLKQRTIGAPFTL